MTKEPSSANCPHIEGCSLYPLFNLETSLKVWQTIYCKGKYTKCARYRYQISSEGRTVSPELLPDGTSLEVTR
jgi:hypothetical protein